jgi:hypothetical protein
LISLKIFKTDLSDYHLNQLSTLCQKDIFEGAESATGFGVAVSPELGATAS